MHGLGMRTRDYLGWASVVSLVLALGLFAPTPSVANVATFGRVRLASSSAQAMAQSLHLRRIESLSEGQSSPRLSTGAAGANVEDGVPVTVVNSSSYATTWYYDLVSGTIRNEYTYPLAFVQVYVTTYDDSHNVIESKMSYAFSDYVRPGEVVGFWVSLSSSPNWSTYSVSAAGQRASEPEPVHLTPVSDSVVWVLSDWRTWSVVFRNDSAATVTGLRITGIENDPSGFVDTVFNYLSDVVVTPDATVSCELPAFFPAVAPVSLSGVQAEGMSAVFPQPDACVIALATGSSSSLAYGSSFVVAGTLKSGGVGVTAQLIILQSAAPGASYKDTSLVATTDAAGAFSFSVKPASKTYYRVRFAGSTGYAAAGPTASVHALPRAYVSTPVAPSSMSHSKYYTVYGYLKPRHTSGTHPVRIYKYRYVSGHWKSYGYVSAKASNYSTYTKYSCSIRLPYKGKWRVRAYALADSGHAATWSSGYDYITVK